MGKFKRVFKLQKNILRTLGKVKNFASDKVDDLAEHHPHNKAFKALQKVKNIATSQNLFQRAERGIDKAERGLNHGYDSARNKVEDHFNHGHNHHPRHNNHHNRNQDY